MTRKRLEPKKNGVFVKRSTMMKKLLVLTLVLGIASLTSAGPDLSTIDNVDYTVDGQTVTIMVDKDIVDLLISLKTDNGTRPVNETFASGFSTQILGYWDTYSLQLEEIYGSKGANAAFQGMIFSFDVAAGVASIDLIQDYYGFGSDLTWADSSKAVLTGTTITMAAVPEPATMALLGLGGLFLRRKK